ncbi:hypothetical protein Ait01nite_023160 [Actinoplanes italicus]|uniref:RNA polymerase sigma-B factor n=1 Tax=Actinoplanes italicus TaxID=113567 RepID=A0A2T0KFZ1_9ACTN|nr:sigma-70 family RNA polymerase sigma factor [Actinoplanes italicus]PRX22305.1 RNA polymerase sigma-B factor [Actinoplanes italicus]GIE29271.1 hypothetical protein Ait01nite_023160 [Actinoplanes italicus]
MSVGQWEAPQRFDERADLDETAEDYAREHAVADAARARRLRDEMVAVALPLADRLARRFRRTSEPLADLEQVARMGLVKAVDRYDPERGSFTAYAINTVVGELKRYLRDHTWGVHVPRRLQELALEVNQNEAVLTRELGRRPDDREVARACGIEPADVAKARLCAAGYRPSSLNMPVGDGSVEYAELFGDVDAALEKTADRLTVAELIARLPDRERHVVVSVFYGGRTQSAIADDLGISQMQVSRVLARVLAWLRAGLLTDQEPRWPGGPDTADGPFEMAPRMLPTGGLEITVSGEVDRDNAAELRDALLALIRRQPAGRHVTLELSRVPLVDAAGIRVLLGVYEAARARDLTVVVTGLTPVMRRVAAVSGLSPMLA